MYPFYSLLGDNFNTFYIVYQPIRWINKANKMNENANNIDGETIIILIIWWLCVMVMIQEQLRNHFLHSVLQIVVLCTVVLFTERHVTCWWEGVMSDDFSLFYPLLNCISTYIFFLFSKLLTK